MLITLTTARLETYSTIIKKSKLVDNNIILLFLKDAEKKLFAMYYTKMGY